MRRLIILSTVTALLVALAVGGAYAANGQVIQCTTIPCIATGNDDLVYERKGNGVQDLIRMAGGDDKVLANKYTNDRDVVRGGAGYDAIYVNDGDTRDLVSSGTSQGGSICYVDARSEASSGCGTVRVQPPR